MPKKECILRIRMTGSYMEKLKNYANAKGTTVSEIVRAYVHRLPHINQIDEPLPIADCTPEAELDINFQGSESQG